MPPSSRAGDELPPRDRPLAPAAILESSSASADGGSGGGGGREGSSPLSEVIWLLTGRMRERCYCYALVRALRERLREREREEAGRQVRKKSEGELFLLPCLERE